MSAVEIITLGCRLNIAESEAIRAALADSQDLVVINSCAVTSEAAAASRKAVRRARRDHPGARVVVTGCASEIDGASFEGLADIVPNISKLDARLYSPPWKGGAGGGLLSLEARAFDPPTPNPSLPGRGTAAGAHARAFLPVQNGCDHRCTFCIIPYGRGPSRSVPAGAAVEAARAAVEAGQREIVLTGIDLTAYGDDLPGAPTLGSLVERLLTLVPGIERLRLSSLDPCEVDDRLFDMIAHEPRVMPHLHFSLQSGDDMILKRMKRRHSRADAVALVERIKAVRPEVAIGADLIAGFPTETDAMFANSLALLDDCDIVLPHIFPFSPRSSTPATRMPQVAREVVRERAARLREAGAKRQQAWLESHFGTVQRVLVERDGESGHAEDFAQVSVRHPGLVPGSTPPQAPEREDGWMPEQVRHDVKGSILKVRITGVEGDTLIGIPA
ncbi:threonylcarbamoyladenosine tRNA methylthiotransferase MtaB [Sphingomonas vulcanisoli]|uniref:Threonylcarbamoyladenosine tRNA methylthiotransferase MtaB n=1 Tax=Sphingomonas vulcanisoli TaxID=1658060 RepID=A0ABX0TS24_9SPHN|nr:threonylcarbamoyladenosine tRNA methylthiotransferase MtaB [Sphingomonas vulcanisoli]